MVFVGFLYSFDRGVKGMLLLSALSGMVMLLYGFQMTGSGGSANSQSSHLKDFGALLILTESSDSLFGISINSIFFPLP